MPTSVLKASLKFDLVAKPASVAVSDARASWLDAGVERADEKASVAVIAAIRIIFGVMSLSSILVKLMFAVGIEGLKYLSTKRGCCGSDDTE